MMNIFQVAHFTLCTNDCYYQKCCYNSYCQASTDLCKTFGTFIADLVASEYKRQQASVEAKSLDRNNHIELECMEHRVEHKGMWYVYQ